MKRISISFVVLCLAVIRSVTLEIFPERSGRARIICPFRENLLLLSSNDLYNIDLCRIVNKWLGETKKNRIVWSCSGQ